MLKFILKRLFELIILIVATAFIIFSILYFTPRNPAAYLLGGTAPANEIANMTHKLGLD